MTFFFNRGSLDQEIVIFLQNLISDFLLFLIKGKYGMKNYNLSDSDFQMF